MESALACGICSLSYDQSDRRPKTLPCGHTYCNACLQHIFSNDARIECPIDREKHYSGPDAFPDNQALKSQLQQLEVRCIEHRDEIVEEYCLLHEAPACSVCHETCRECRVKSIVEDLQEIRTFVFSKIEEAMHALSSGSLSDELRTRNGRKYTDTLQENLKLLSELRNAQNRPSEDRCALCQCEVLDFYLPNFEVYCRGCWTPHETLTELKQTTQKELADQMKDGISNLLKDVNFSDLCADLLSALSSSDPQQLRAVGKHLFSLKGQRADWTNLPDYFYCPGCLCCVYKQDCDMLILPCRSLHAVCRTCALALAFPMVCPLDKMVFQQTAGQLLPLARPEPPPASYNMHWQTYEQPWLATMQPQVPKEEHKGQHWDRMLTLPPAPPPDESPVRWGLPRHDSSPPTQSLPEPISATSQIKVIGTPIPQSSFAQYQTLERFNSVLPSLSARIDGENKGWFVYVEKNQVEVVTFLAAESVNLCGIALANPYQQGIVAVVESVSLYNGPDGQGQSLYSHSSRQELVGGNSIFTDLFFTDPFPMQNGQHYTLKVKLTGPSQLRLFRGNSFDRPDVWIGSDALLWDFEETKLVEKGEFTNGQNNLSGPILRLYYVR